MIFAGICIITENVSRFSDFYEKVLKTTAEGDETHAMIHTMEQEPLFFQKTVWKIWWLVQ